MKLVIDTGYTACNYYFFLSQKKDDNYEGVELISLSVAWKYWNCVMLLMQTWPCDRHDRRADHANINVRVIDMAQCHHFWFLQLLFCWNQKNFFLYFFIFFPCSLMLIMQTIADLCKKWWHCVTLITQTLVDLHLLTCYVINVTQCQLFRYRFAIVWVINVTLTFVEKKKQTDKNCNRDKGKACWHSNRKEALVELR